MQCLTAPIVVPLLVAPGLVPQWTVVPGLLIVFPQIPLWLACAQFNDRGTPHDP